MRMEELYNKTKAKYESTVRTLLSKNAALINTRKTPIITKPIQFQRSRSILPLIPTSLKSNFFIITPLNLFTKDEPILRYVPTMQSGQPSSITWFEGITFGGKSFDSDDMIDLIFVKIMESEDHKVKAIEFIQSKFGRTPKDALKIRANSEIVGLDMLFCSVCTIFGCRIHQLHNPRVLKCNDKRECNCNSRKPQSMPTLPPSYMEVLQNTSLSGCIISRIIEIKHRTSIPCVVTNRCQLKPKKVTTSRLNSDAKQFYEPCEHSGECSERTCGCLKNGTVCEAFCSCQICNNLIFCDCKTCDKDCPCRGVDRECTDLCDCSSKHGTQFCANMPALQRVEIKTSVGKSSRHGLGLFAEEFIKASSYVLEYTGELITDKEAERRGNFYEMNKLSYLFNAAMHGNDCLYSIDAFFIGNKTRFINHSVADANIKSKILVSHGNIKVVFYSLRDIFKGEELLFDYQFTKEHKEKHGIAD